MLIKQTTKHWCKQSSYDLCHGFPDKKCSKNASIGQFYETIKAILKQHLLRVRVPTEISESNSTYSALTKLSTTSKAQTLNSMMLSWFCGRTCMFNIRVNSRLLEF